LKNSHMDKWAGIDKIRQGRAEVMLVEV
jgi:hypothetical protein